MLWSSISSKKGLELNFSLDILTWKAPLPTCPPLTFFSPFSSYTFWLLNTAVRFAKYDLSFKTTLPMYYPIVD